MWYTITSSATNITGEWPAQWPATSTIYFNSPSPQNQQLRRRQRQTRRRLRRESALATTLCVVAVLVGRGRASSGARNRAHEAVPSVARTPPPRALTRPPTVRTCRMRSRRGDPPHHPSCHRKGRAQLPGDAGCLDEKELRPCATHATSSTVRDPLLMLRHATLDQRAIFPAQIPQRDLKPLAGPAMVVTDLDIEQPSCCGVGPVLGVISFAMNRDRVPHLMRE